MKIIKKFIAVGLSVMMVLLAGCSGTAAQQEQTNVSDRGRYLESEYTLPESIGEIHEMVRLENGKIRLAGETGIYDSDDDGQTWQRAEAESAVLKEREEDYVCDMAIDQQGRVFISYFSGTGVLVETDGTATAVTPELPELPAAETADSDEMLSQNTLYSLIFAPDRTLIGCDFGGSMYRVDAASGAILNTYEINGVDNYAVVGEKLVVASYAGMEIFDLETGVLKELEQPLKEYFDGRDSTIDVCALIQAAADTFYYSDSSGLYRYTFDAGEMEQLIDGTLTTMGNPTYEVKQIIEGADHSFLMLYQDTDNGQYVLKYYEYSEAVAATPQHEISVYSLTDSEDIRIAIANFQTANPDYYVKLEIGMSEADGVTSADAISTLNTNIMAGNGPDVLMLDGLPIDSYIEKGLLADLSELVAGQTSDRVFYEQIVNAYKSESGLYAVTTRFVIPFLEGADSDIEGVTELTSFSAKVQELRAADSEIDTILGGISAAELLADLFLLCRSNIETANGTIDEAALTAFLDAAKAIYDADHGSPDSEMAAIEIDFRGVKSNLMGQFFTIFQNQQKINQGWLIGISDLQMMEGINNKMSWDYKLSEFQNQQTFRPIGTIGMNAKSSNTEKGAEFIKYMLSDELQSNSQIQGFPVSEAALNQSIENNRQKEPGTIAVGISGTDETTMISIDLHHISDAGIENLKAVIDKMDTPLIDNSIISGAISDAGAAYLNGQQELSETVEKILKTVNLYLSE